MVTIVVRILKIMAMLDETATDYREKLPLEDKKRIITYLLNGACAEGDYLYSYPAKVNSSLINELSVTDWGEEQSFANGSIWVTIPTGSDAEVVGSTVHFSTSLSANRIAEMYNQFLGGSNHIHTATRNVNYAGGVDRVINIVDDVLTPEEGTLRGSNE